MGVGTITNMGAVAHKFSQRLDWRRWDNLTLNDDTGFIQLELTPDRGAPFYGTVNQVGGQNMDFDIAGARSSWQIDVYADTFFGWEPENAYTLISYIPIFTVAPIQDMGYVHFFRVINSRRWDSGQLWVYRGQWIRSGTNALPTVINRVKNPPSEDATNNIQ